MCPEAEIVEAFQKGFGEVLGRFFLLPLAAFFLAGYPTLIVRWIYKKLSKQEPPDTFLIILYMSFTLFLVALSQWIPL